MKADAISAYVAAAGPDGWDRIVTTPVDEWPGLDEHPAPLRFIVERLGAGIDARMTNRIAGVFLTIGTPLSHVGDEWAQLVREVGVNVTVSAVRSLAREHLRHHSGDLAGL